MKKVFAAVIVMIALLITFYCSSSYISGRVDKALSITDLAIEDIEKEDFASALKNLYELKSDMEDTAPTLQKLLVHENVEEIMRSIDEAIVYCEHNIKVEAIKEVVGAQYLLKSLKEIETLSFTSIF